MAQERKERLESLQWWAWTVRPTHVIVDWDARFDELVAYHAEHGRCPPKSTPGGLGRWVNAQRHARTTMSAERKAKLGALEWWACEGLTARRAGGL